MNRLEAYTSQRKINKLKNRLRSRYSSYVSRLDDFDCGANLAAVISLDVSKLARECNEILDELAVLDPDNTPKDRMPLGG